VLEICLLPICLNIGLSEKATSQMMHRIMMGNYSSLGWNVV